MTDLHSTPPGSHHHGNLRPALIAAGIEILETDGVSGLSLRKIAATVGVSHAAPAHHFKGKTGLLVAIATEGFRVFCTLMEQRRDSAGTAPREQLLGLCQGYLEFAETHEGLFGLIFSTEIKGHADEDLRLASKRAFQLLEDVCALFESASNHAQSNEIMIWSLVHGYATLRVYNMMRSPSGGEVLPFEAILPPLIPR
ncbi:TetR/AcrR family transcriptional regulator [Phaeobacter sp. C3_T13_0]|uniref:TetR/AcrR family transcriptional regulator n=1 Tax=Phaeobacter cretensis TaxID=3342641 RepID=UPI0039BCD806